MKHSNMAIRTHHGVHHSGKKHHDKGKRKIEKVMHEYKEGELHSGHSKKPVSSHKQAVAIALSEARKAGANIPKKGE